MPPARQYLSIRPFSRRYRIWDIAPRPCLSILPCNPEIWKGVTPPARRGCGICPLRPPHPSEISPRQYLRIPFPSPKYRIWDLTSTHQYLSILPCSRRYRIWDIAPRQYLFFPLSSPKYRIWDMPPARQYLFIRPCSRRYRIWDIAPRPCLSILLSNPEILISYASVSVHSLLHPQI